MSPDLRLTSAVIAGKATATASRLLRRGGGTTAPGDVALAVDRGALRKLGAGLIDGSVLVTGTNGKTTTTGLIATAMAAAGERVLTNRSGANLVYGLTAALLGDAAASGRPRSRLAVFEVDELSLERAVVELRPRCVVVLNLLRDQLDRSGELQTTAGRIGDALRRLPAGSTVVFNADDPFVAWQCHELGNTVAVGIDATEHLLPGLPHAADARSCPRCGTALRFTRVVLGHCGDYHCDACGFGRPQPHLTVTHLEAPALDRLHLVLNDGTDLDVAVGGVYNALNSVAAAATCRVLGLDGDATRRGLASFRPRFGRQETLRLYGARLRMMLAKNPTGFDEVLRTLDELGGVRTYLIAINDGIADGRDVSWLWDVDFERLARSAHRPRIIAAGRRAQDLAVRLKYAEVPAERLIAVETDPERALRHAAGIADAGEEIAVVPTYTAMMELRAVAERAGAAPLFWEGSSPVVAPAERPRP